MSNRSRYNGATCHINNHSQTRSAECVVFTPAIKSRNHDVNTLFWLEKPCVQQLDSRHQ